MNIYNNINFNKLSLTRGQVNSLYNFEKDCLKKNWRRVFLTLTISQQRQLYIGMRNAGADFEKCIRFVCKYYGDEFIKEDIAKRIIAELTRRKEKTFMRNQCRNKLVDETITRIVLAYLNKKCKCTLRKECLL